jgi:hypothetical protein
MAAMKPQQANVAGPGAWQSWTTRGLVAGAIVLASLTSARSGLADASANSSPTVATADHPTSVAVPRHRTFGMTMDIGVPDGAGLGLVVRPYLDWLRLAASVTHNGMAPGVRGGLTLDPIKFPLAPTLTVEGGHYWEGSLPIVKDSPAIGYNYANFHLGLEVGNRDTFRFFMRGGASWIDVSTAHFQNTPGGSGSTLGNPSYSGWLAPSAKLGFAAYF